MGSVPKLALTLHSPEKSSGLAAMCSFTMASRRSKTSGGVLMSTWTCMLTRHQ